MVDRVGGRVPVLVDSGYRRGSDIVKALALGASAVLVGRATLYGTAAAGEAGATRAIDILRDEIGRVLALVGCRGIDELGPELLQYDEAMFARFGSSSAEVVTREREKSLAVV
jgi:(S)-mandelate dehydrogenase